MDVASHLLGECNPCREAWTEEGSPSEPIGKERRNERSYLEKQLGREAIENGMMPAVLRAKVTKVSVEVEKEQILNQGRRAEEKRKVTRERKKIALKLCFYKLKSQNGLFL